MRSELTSLSEWRRPISDIRTLHVILSLRCNYRCEFCFQPNFRDDLPEHVWQERLVPVYPGLREVVLHGGEPTAVPRFVTFCDIVRSVNDTSRFSLFTNGFRFRDYWVDLMLARGRFVNFSVNAATRETYAQVNRRNHYDSVMETVRDFAAKRRASGSDVAIDFSFVITGRNLGEMADFLTLAAEHDVDRVRFFFDMDQRPPDADEVRRELDRAMAVRADLPDTMTVWGLEIFAGRFFRAPVPDAHLESTGCRRTFENLYVGVRGQASFCNFLESRSIGNLLEQEVADVWNSPVALEQRRAQAMREWDYCVSAYCGPTERTGSTTRVGRTVRTVEPPRRGAVSLGILSSRPRTGG